MSKKNIAILLGATGLTGSALLNELLSSNYYDEIKVIARKNLNILDSRIELIQIKSLNELSNLDLNFQNATYFCCLGTTLKTAGTKENFKAVDLKAVVDFALLAKKFNAFKFILISAMGANPNSTIFYNQVKGQAEQEILKLQIPGTVIFRPSLLLGERSEKRKLESFFIKVAGAISKILSPKIEKLIGTKISVLVKRMVEVAMEQNQNSIVFNSSEI